MNFFVYMLRCADNSLYTGYTNDPEARLRVHNGDKPGGGTRYTRSRRPVTVVYTESFKTKSEAMVREAALKKLSKIQKEQLIAEARK